MANVKRSTRVNGKVNTVKNLSVGCQEYLDSSTPVHQHFWDKQEISIEQNLIY